MNVFDYLSWRGDLTFLQAPFSEVDNLLISLLSYVDLNGIFPDQEDRKDGLPLKEISDRFFFLHSAKELKNDHSLLRKMPQVLKAMGASPRFRDLRLFHYCDQFDKSRLLQFAALELRLPDGTSFLSFRGTDDSLAGWEESFRMSTGTVEAGRAATAYTVCAAARTEGKLLLGGHSKGGNLAIYAAATVPEDVRSRIAAVYSNDGPGFLPDFLARPAMQELSGRITTIIPRDSVVGMLMTPASEPIRVKSSARGLLQHDGLTWSVLGPHFVQCPKPGPLVAHVNASLSAWLDTLTEDTRDRVIHDLFTVLESSGTTTLSELMDGGIRTIYMLRKSTEALNPESRQVIQQLLLTITKPSRKERKTL